MRMILALLVSLSLLAGTVRAQDGRLLDRLPEVPGAYFWTADLPATMKQLETFDPSPFEMIDQVFQAIEETDERQPKRIAAWENACVEAKFIADELRSDLFDGEAIFLQVGMEATPKQAMLLETTDDHARVIEFLERLESLVTNMQTSPPKEALEEDDEAVELAEDEASLKNRGHVLSWTWELADQVLILSSDPKLVTELKELLRRPIDPNQRLVAQRQFQNLFRQLAPKDSAPGDLYFFIHAEAQPFASGIVRPFFPVFSYLIPGPLPRIWESAFLTDLRGLGGRMAIGETAFNKRLETTFSIEAFQLVTRPRRGLFACFADDPKLNFDEPLFATPFSSYAQVAIDGERMYDELDQVSESIFTKLKGDFVGWEEVRSSWLQARPTLNVNVSREFSQSITHFSAIGIETEFLMPSGDLYLERPSTFSFRVDTNSEATNANENIETIIQELVTSSIRQEEQVPITRTKINGGYIWQIENDYQQSFYDKAKERFRIDYEGQLADLSVDRRHRDDESEKQLTWATQFFTRLRGVNEIIARNDVATVYYMHNGWVQTQGSCGLYFSLPQLTQWLDEESLMRSDLVEADKAKSGLSKAQRQWLQLQKSISVAESTRTSGTNSVAVFAQWTGQIRNRLGFLTDIIEPGPPRPSSGKKTEVDPRSLRRNFEKMDYYFGDFHQQVMSWMDQGSSDQEAAFVISVFDEDRGVRLIGVWAK